MRGRWTATATVMAESEAQKQREREKQILFCSEGSASMGKGWRQTAVVGQRVDGVLAKFRNKKGAEPQTKVRKVRWN